MSVPLTRDKEAIAAAVFSIMDIISSSSASAVSTGTPAAAGHAVIGENALTHANGGDVPPNTENPPDSEGGQVAAVASAPFHCDICGIGFADRLTLAAHHRKHTGKRNRRVKNAVAASEPLRTGQSQVPEKTVGEEGSAEMNYQLVESPDTSATEQVHSGAYAGKPEHDRILANETPNADVTESAPEHHDSTTDLTNVVILEQSCIKEEAHTSLVVDCPVIGPKSVAQNAHANMQELPAQACDENASDAATVVDVHVNEDAVIVTQLEPDQQVEHPRTNEPLLSDQENGPSQHTNIAAATSVEQEGSPVDVATDLSTKECDGNHAGEYGDFTAKTKEIVPPKESEALPVADRGISNDEQGDQPALSQEICDDDPYVLSCEVSGGTSSAKRKQRLPKKRSRSPPPRISVKKRKGKPGRKPGRPRKHEMKVNMKSSKQETRRKSAKSVASAAPLLFQCALCKDRFAHVSELTEHVTSHLNNDSAQQLEVYSNPPTPMLDPANLLLASMNETYLQGPAKKNAANTSSILPDEGLGDTRDDMDNDGFNDGADAGSVSPQEEEKSDTEELNNSLIPPRPPPDDTPLTCEECNMLCIGMEALVDHVYEHYKRRHVRCNQCGASFAYEWMLKHHDRLVHSEGSVVNTKVIPGLVFPLRRRGRKKKTKGKKYVPKRRYKKRGEDPSNIGHLQCDECAFPARNWDQLNEHCTSSHSPIGSFKCRFCHRTFQQKCLVPGHVCPGEPDPLAEQQDQLSESLIKIECIKTEPLDPEVVPIRKPGKKRGRKRKKPITDDGGELEAGTVEAAPTRRSRRQRKTRVINFGESSDEDDEQPKHPAIKMEPPDDEEIQLDEINMEVAVNRGQSSEETEDDMLQKPVKKRKLARRLCSSPESIAEPTEQATPKALARPDDQPLNQYPGRRHPHECEVCGRRMAHKQALLRHKQIHERTPETELYKCDQCPTTFTRLDSLVTHALKVHSEVRNFKCHLCRSSFSIQSCLDYHLRDHRAVDSGCKTKDMEYACVQCGVKIKHMTALRRHMKQHSEEKNVFTCELCPKQYSRLDCLMLHTKVHSLDRPFRCAVCSRTFAQKRCLEYHSVVHGVDPAEKELPYQCDLCHRGFEEEIHLRAHRARHEENRVFLCDTCGKGFKTSGKLKRHAMIHTGERPFQCRVCGMRFIDSTALAAHEKIHSGERPFMCHICGKDFARNVTLQVHHRTHSGDKPYPCDVCSKSFATITQRTRHRRVHTGEKPYVCRVCNRGFNQTTHLRVHMRVHMRPEGGHAPKKSSNKTKSAAANGAANGAANNGANSAAIELTQASTLATSPSISTTPNPDARAQSVVPVPAVQATLTPLVNIGPAPRHSDMLTLATLAAVEATPFMAPGVQQPTTFAQKLSKQKTTAAVSQPESGTPAHPRFLLQHAAGPAAESPRRIEQHILQQPLQQRWAGVTKPLNTHQSPSILSTIQQQHILMQQQQQFERTTNTSSTHTLMPIHQHALYQGDNSQHSQLSQQDIEATDMTMHFLDQ